MQEPGAAEETEKIVNVEQRLQHFRVRGARGVRRWSGGFVEKENHTVLISQLLPLCLVFAPETTV